jgi:hypothetical protein
MDEHLAISVVGGDWPEGVPDSEDRLLPLSCHWRLLQRLHSPGSRPLLDEAAQLAAQYGGGWLVAETLAAGLTFGRTLWFGTEANVGRIVTSAAGSLGIQVHVLAA